MRQNSGGSKIMVDKTEQKIIDTSLKIFAEKGYAGSTTRNLAEMAGFSEMTLFRKFKTKRNLFNMVLIQNREKIVDDLDSTFKDEDFQNPEEFLRNFIEKVIDLIDNNFEFISIVMNGDSKLYSKMKGSHEQFFPKIGEYLSSLNIFQNSDIDPYFFAFNATTFCYFINLDKHMGQNSINGEKLVEEFINHYSECI